MNTSPQHVTIKQRLANRERVNVFAVGRSFHPNQVEMYGLQGGFNGFWIDHEHTGFTIDQIESAARAGRVWGLDSFVRVAPTDYALVTRCLESGVCGVMAAQVFTPEQAEQFVQWAKFAPRGVRGLNSGGHDGKFGLLPTAEFCRQANENSFVAIQIETREAVDRCDEIAAIDGVDLLFIGPADLSQAYGVPGQSMHPDCLMAVAKIAQACEKHGKTFGSVSVTPEHTTMLLDQGCSMISMTNDIRTFQDGIATVKQRFPMLFP
ncbi:HpcH/HpaI aldolase family protein [Planctomicrobium sp. SH661]|uniref:HpcH/HpaI aldolase family protein n=1 Tax=Planctomicrobium sp. SH661 TaxID=3448124 RepID=UPI003F5C6C51